MVKEVKLFSSGTLVSSAIVLTEATIVSGGNDSMYVHSGGTANSTIVSQKGYLYVRSGGTANSTTVNSRGELYVNSGGTANSTAVNAGGSLFVRSGGTVTDVVWIPCEGRFYAVDGAVVTYASCYSGVYLGSNNTLLSSAAVMYSEKLTDEVMYVMSGGTANCVTVNSDGYLYVSSGGTANSITVNSDGFLYVHSGGTATSTAVNSGGSLIVGSGGTAADMVWTPGEG